jgi:hypothetical protein
VKIETLEQAKRAAFMGAYRGLRSQGWRQSAVGGACAYRGNGGTCCAVGWLIPDSRYTEALEGHGASFFVNCNEDDVPLAKPLADWWRAASYNDKRAFQWFLIDVQRAHDNGNTRRQMRVALDAIRIEHNWPVPSEVA